MTTVIKLDIDDVTNILAEYFQVPKMNVNIIDCGYEEGDGPYPGRGNYIDIEVEKNKE